LSGPDHGTRPHAIDRRETGEAAVGTQTDAPWCLMRTKHMDRRQVVTGFVSPGAMQDRRKWR